MNEHKTYMKRGFLSEGWILSFKSSSFKNTEDGILFPQPYWTRELFLQPENYPLLKRLKRNSFWAWYSEILSGNITLEASSSTNIIPIITIIIRWFIMIITWNYQGSGSSQWLDKTPVRTQGLSHSRPCLETCWRKYNAHIIVCCDYLHSDRQGSLFRECDVFRNRDSKLSLSINDVFFCFITNHFP